MIKRLVKWLDGMMIDLEYAWIWFRTMRQLRRQRPDLSFFPRMHLANKAMEASLVHAQIAMAAKYGAKPIETSSSSAEQ